MPDEKPTTETVETPAKVAEVTEPVTPPALVEEPFDKDRAMNTIHVLREVEKQAKKDAKELEQFKAEKKKQEDAALTESERLTKQAAELQTKNVKLEGDILRRDVISETGLPATFADRLKGTTKEELLADAQELAKTLPTMKVAPKIPPTDPAGASTKETEVQKRERLYGKQGNVFDDFDAIKAGGGGVFMKGAK